MMRTTTFHTVYNLLTTLSLLWAVTFHSLEWKCEAFQAISPIPRIHVPLTTPSHHAPIQTPFQPQSQPYNPRETMLHDILKKYGETGDRNKKLSLYDILKSYGEKEDKRNKLSQEYGVASKAYFLLSFAMLLVHVKIYALTWNSFVPFLYVASTPVLAGGVSSILPSAVDHNRLKSDTYQRLNLFLIHFSLVQLLGVVLDIGNFFKRGCISAIVAVLGLIPAWKGWNYGIVDADIRSGRVQALWNSGMDMMKTSLKFKNNKAMGYLFVSYFVMFLKIQKLLEILRLAKTGGSDIAQMIAVRLFRYSKLALLFGSVITLKSAADRDRLEGTTFIQLNYVSSLVFLLMGLRKITFSSSSPEPLVALTCSMFCGFHGISSALKKKQTN